MLQENGQLCIALACLDNVTLLTSVLGSGNNEFLAKESNAPASNGLKKNHERKEVENRKRSETNKKKINQYKDWTTQMVREGGNKMNQRQFVFLVSR